MNDPKGYYGILGVKSSATQDEIKAAYRRKSLEVHPDTSEYADSHDQFINLQEAYEVLKDHNKRSNYDSSGVSVPNGTDAPTNCTDQEDSEFEPIRCSSCGRVTAQPRYVVFWETFSLLSTVRTPIQGVMCRKCAGRAAYAATKKSLIFGWWGVWGLVFTPITVIGNLSGGSLPPENNGRLLLHQAWYFAKQGKLDLAYFLAKDALPFLDRSNTENKETLVTICQSIIRECKEFSTGKSLDAAWDKPLPQTGSQWKAVGICAAAWLVGISLISSYGEEQTRQRRAGAPAYTYQQDPAPIATPTPTTLPPVEETIPPIPTTYLPLDTGYLPGKELGAESGHSTLTLKNNSDGNYHVRLYKREFNEWILAREAHLKANESIEMRDLPPGEYETRRMNVQSKDASKSSAFTLEETEDESGIQYTAFTITMDAARGNSRIIPIDANEF